MSIWLPSVPQATASSSALGESAETTAAAAASPNSTQVLRSLQSMILVSTSTPMTRMRLPPSRTREAARSSAWMKPAQPLPPRV